MEEKKDTIYGCNSDEAISYYKKAVSSEQSKDYEKALLYLDKSIELKKDYYDAYIKKGDILFIEYENVGLASNEYYYAIQLKTDKAEAYIKMIEACIGLGDYSEALEFCDKAYELFPESYRDHYRMKSYILYCMGDYDRALKQVNKSISLYPEEIENYRQRARLYHDMKKYEEALQDYNYIMNKEPDMLCEHSRNLTVFKAGRVKDALKYANEYIKKYPECENGYFLRMLCFRELNHYETALIDCDKAIELSKNKVAYSKYRLGLIKVIYENNNKDMFYETISVVLEFKKEYSPGELNRIMKEMGATLYYDVYSFNRSEKGPVWQSECYLDVNLYFNNEEVDAQESVDKMELQYPMATIPTEYISSFAEIAEALASRFGTQMILNGTSIDKSSLLSYLDSVTTEIMEEWGEEPGSEVLRMMIEDNYS